MENKRSNNGWTVSGINLFGGAKTVTAYAYCL